MLTEKRVERKCSECNKAEILSGPVDIKRALRMVVDSLPYVCVECEKKIMGHMSFNSSNLKDIANVEARRRINTPINVLSSKVEEIVQRSEQERTEQDKKEENEVAKQKLAYQCSHCDRGFTTKKGLNHHMTIVNKKESKIGVETLRRSEPAITQQVVADNSHFNINEFVEVKIHVLGKEVTYDQFLSIVNRMLEIRESMKRPT